nr:nuclear transport factor 2 family protein [Nocardioides yefusunii]
MPEVDPLGAAAPGTDAAADEGVSRDDAPLLAPGVEEVATDPRETVLDLERALLTDAVRSDVERVADLLHPEWSEIGRSGRLLTREGFLQGVGPVGHVDMDVLEVSEVSPGVVLIVWRSHGRAGATLRSSWWVRERGEWFQRFHHASAERA